MKLLVNGKLTGIVAPKNHITHVGSDYLLDDFQNIWLVWIIYTFN